MGRKQATVGRKTSSNIPVKPRDACASVLGFRYTGLLQHSV